MIMFVNHEQQILQWRLAIYEQQKIVNETVIASEHNNFHMS